MTRPDSTARTSPATAPGEPELLKGLLATDRLIHEPSRLAILSYLDVVTEADFMSLVHHTGISRGNLTIQLDKLEEGGLIQTERVIRHRRTRRTARLTQQGKGIINDYWKWMETFRDRLGEWRKAADASTDEEGGA